MSELTLSEDGERKKGKKKGKKRQRRPPVALPPELERHRRIPVEWAAAIKGISPDGFRRHYAHLIDQVSPRRQAVILGKVIDEA